MKVDQYRFFAISTQFCVAAKFLTRLRNSVSSVNSQTLSCAKMKDRRAKEARSFLEISVAENLAKVDSESSPRWGSRNELTPCAGKSPAGSLIRPDASPARNTG